ncbi:hypothetical protein BDY21DRAFT_369837 [Lineolata rhizophorae]|uniref:Uncharacterized protein n=1 Tax=Lineolata rhizophorae TaxID=578093 RepID=A0A6A6P8X9_9PEZI|nr:hypothetical protein BDY21DRAFT_369837 [Lineolata rhizophorae]
MARSSGTLVWHARLARSSGTLLGPRGRFAALAPGLVREPPNVAEASGAVEPWLPIPAAAPARRRHWFASTFRAMDAVDPEAALTYDFHSPLPAPVADSAHLRRRIARPSLAN